MPRSEMQGILHMLVYTKGNAIIIIDNKNVVNTCLKGHRARPKFNGLLWSAIFQAARVRTALDLSGLGVILAMMLLFYKVLTLCIGLSTIMPTMLLQELPLHASSQWTTSRYALMIRRWSCESLSAR